jgi:hypothetical protein
MQDISLQGHKEDAVPWRIDEAFQAASKEFSSGDNHISKNCLIMVNGEHETSRDSPALFADVALAKTESSNEGNQGTSCSCVHYWYGMGLYFIVLVSIIGMEWGFILLYLCP